MKKFKTRKYERNEPLRDAKKIYIYCEGQKREYQYFLFFQGLDTRINIIPYPLQSNEDNSPMGLYEIAHNQCVKTEKNPNPQNELLEIDEVWFVIDTDNAQKNAIARENQIENLRQSCSQNPNWFVVQSNPCFEIWLYYHLFCDMPTNSNQCSDWKQIVNQTFIGGFSCQKHCVLIDDAIQNATKMFDKFNQDLSQIGTTEVFRLAQIIYNFTSSKISMNI